MKFAKKLFMFLLVGALCFGLGVGFSPYIAPRVAGLLSDLAVYSGAITPASAAAVMPEGAEGAALSVTGQGAAAAAPDMATIILGVRIEADTVVGAQAQVNQLLPAVTEAVLAQGVLPQDIKTESIAIYPNYQYTSGRETLSGYVAHNTVSVVVRDIDKVGAVIDSAAQAGANQMDGVSLGISDSRAAYQKALEAAVSDGTEKARVLAKASGHTLGKLRMIEESPSYEVSPMFGAREMADGAAAETQIHQGELSIAARVVMEFVLE